MDYATGADHLDICRRDAGVCRLLRVMETGAPGRLNPITAPARDLSATSSRWGLVVAPDQQLRLQVECPAL